MARSGHTIDRFVARARQLYGLPTAAVKAMVSQCDETVVESLLPSPATTSTTIDTESALFECLALTAYACWRSRWPLSLALIEIDAFPKLILAHGARPAARLARLVHDRCACCAAPQASFTPLRQYRFALTLADCNQRRAGRLCHELVSDVRDLVPADSPESATRISISVGLSTVTIPTQNLVPHALFKSSSLCLWAAQLAGGNTFKSAVLS